METPASASAYLAHTFPVSVKGVAVQDGKVLLLDCWQYHIRQGSDVVIVTYGCHVRSTDPPVISNEHKRVGLFAPGQVPELVMPDGYKRSVAAWFASLDDGQHEGSTRWQRSSHRDIAPLPVPPPVAISRRARVIFRAPWK